MAQVQKIQIEARADEASANLIPLVHAAADRIAAGEVKGKLEGNGGHVQWHRFVSEGDA